MSSKEIMAILIPTGVIALVWVIFESAVLKVVKKKGKSSDNKGKAEIKLKKENSTDSIDSNIKTGKGIVVSYQISRRRNIYSLAYGYPCSYHGKYDHQFLQHTRSFDRTGTWQNWTFLYLPPPFSQLYTLPKPS